MRDLFVFFFTEMWERFSFYGMRFILVLFFMASIFDETGWEWITEKHLHFRNLSWLVVFNAYVGGLLLIKL
jgi:proton-dependent oligopeptide transporter, POT family